MTTSAPVRRAAPAAVLSPLAHRFHDTLVLFKFPRGADVPDIGEKTYRVDRLMAIERVRRRPLVHIAYALASSSYVCSLKTASRKKWLPASR